MILIYKILEKLHNQYARLRGIDDFHIRPEDIHVNSEQASEIIYNLLSSSQPCMISRFGSTELSTIVGILEMRKKCHSPLNYIIGKSPAWWNKTFLCNQIRDFSGFFPAEPELVEDFVNLVLEDIKQIDVLGSWVQAEKYLDRELVHSTKVFLKDLEPFWTTKPWSMALKGKKVLVVHPFANQILTQYNKHKSQLFKNPLVLPDFELETIPAVQSLGGENNKFKNWFEALQSMKDEIDKHNYDICLIGCGAYGMSLAAHVKRRGKKAVHLAGALQLLFGIIGNRWENPIYGVKEWGIPIGTYSNLINEFWVRPGEEGRPKNANKVEGACYW